MATPAAEITYLLDTLIEAQYPGLAEVAKYFNPNTMTLAATLPSPQDQFLKYIVMRALSLRNASDAEMFADMDTSERLDLIDDMIRRLTADSTILTSIIASLSAYYAVVAD